jgi:hypothetical protein
VEEKGIEPSTRMANATFSQLIYCPEDSVVDPHHVKVMLYAEVTQVVG